MAQFLRLSPTTGINLDHILFWEDHPNATNTQGDAFPCLTLRLAVGGTTRQGEPVVYKRQLYGEERETLLLTLNMMAPSCGSAVGTTPT